MSVLTRLGRPDPSTLARAEEVSPSLLFHKWQAYDGEQASGRSSAARPSGSARAAGFETTASRLPFLEQVAGAVNRLVAGSGQDLYRCWRSRYLEALAQLDPGEVSLVPATTLWRLVAGFGSNPALESGLHLYPIYGFPYLPGSSVRGLVHHVAEMQLLDDPERQGWWELAEPPGAAALDRFLSAAAQVRAVFGSLSVEPIAADAWRQAAGGAPRRETPRSLLGRWLAGPALHTGERRAQASRCRALLAGQTGGLVAFYDAVPDAGTAGLVQVDILNPHYPAYYGSQAPGLPPSDDQDPRPVYFLAVRPGARFTFPWRLLPWPERPTDTAGEERLAAVGSLARTEAAELVAGWLTAGLEAWGAGGKTAAGYGYFTLEGRAATVAAASEPQRDSPAPQRRPATASGTPNWPARVRSIGWGEAEAQVPRLLADLAADERQQAAIELVRILGRRKLVARADKPWASDLLAAAGASPSKAP